MKRLAFTLGFLLGLGASVAKAQVPPPVTRIAIDRPAERFLDSLAHISRTARIETVGCLTSYAVHGDTLVLTRFAPSLNIIHADSANVWGNGPYLCPMGVPGLHTHIVMAGYEWWQPSQDADVPSSQRVGVWALLLIVSDAGWRVVVY